MQIPARDVFEIHGYTFESAARALRLRIAYLTTAKMTALPAANVHAGRTGPREFSLSPCVSEKSFSRK
jgi:hypothetical protein